MRPGIVTIDDSRVCQAAAERDSRQLAATGDCFDTLTILVDLAAGP